MTQKTFPSIESRLKVTLPEDLGSSLMDGVVLCHLVNHIRPRSVASIHVPSPAVPKLSMAKCRRNVENFLEACRKMGVPEVIQYQYGTIVAVNIVFKFFFLVLYRKFYLFIFYNTLHGGWFLQFLGVFFTLLNMFLLTFLIKNIS
uniref:Calponin-homology (CH) domain-containing protein n=1 Tax=Erpetoichthys calabaricus TaxID=27687 RepID=A0A8C4RYD1_ERPCA